jgi:hypothetical protein
MSADGMPINPIIARVARRLARGVLLGTGFPPLPLRREAAATLPKVHRNPTESALKRPGHGSPFGTFTATELIETDFGEVRWAVPGILPEGLTILGGKPKMGKSWMALGWSDGQDAIENAENLRPVILQVAEIAWGA